MKNKNRTLVVDSGTTGTRSIVFDDRGEILGSSYLEHQQFFPKPGFVEHDPLEIYNNTVKTMKIALTSAKLNFEDVSALGITNQRETVVVWDKNGTPYAPAIVWQDTRTAEICRKLNTHVDENFISKTTGLLINTYFSGVKLKWLNENLTNLNNEEVYWGTIDSWLIWKLTNNKKHVIDCTNASRTLLMDIKTLEWSSDLVEIFEIPSNFIFPNITSSITPDTPFGYVNKRIFNSSEEIPISVVLGDQQAALFGQTCLNPGDIKNTFGTGCFTLLNTGKLQYSTNRLLSTVAYQFSDKEPVYALEGATPIAGAAVQWLRDNLGLINNAEDSEREAKRVNDTGGVVFVPAFVGLYSPYWDTSARGLLIGLERGTKKEHIIRAALEGIAWSTEELILSMKKDVKDEIKINKLRVDGGACKNNLLMQMQADYSQLQIDRPLNIESTSNGIHLALGISLGLYDNKGDLGYLWKKDTSFFPEINMKDRDSKFEKWKLAVSKSRGWLN
ncbi:MAG: glycerol kinase GlpK [Candidatus Hodarchaeales archaeon]|jgi:glycerol kinase